MQKTFSIVKGLAGKSAIYSLGGILMRAIGFFLLPLYTSYLTPGDYGILAVTGIVLQILTIVFPLGMQEAITRFFFSTKTQEERQRMSGAIWLAMLIFSLAGTILLDRLGVYIFPYLFQDVPFDPYIRMAIWTAFFNAITLLPLIFFQVKEHPIPYTITLVLSNLLTYLLIVIFIVTQKEGAFSYMQGHFLAMALLTIPYALITIHHLKIAVDWSIVKAALAFGIPLVPHALAVWVLEFSDRVILQRFVSLDDLGIYGMGYTFGAVMLLIGKSVNTAWVPFFYRAVEEADEDTPKNLTRLVTYYVLALVFLALAQMLLVKELITLLTTPAFHPASRIAPWIIGGQLFYALVYIPANFLLVNKKTRLLPVVTVTAGMVNVGLNLWLVPRYGIMAAAWATLISYGLMLVLSWSMAMRVHPLPYEFKRIAVIGLVATTFYCVGSILPISSVVLALIIKTALLALFPLALIVLGIFTPTEKQYALYSLRRAWVKLLHPSHE